LKKKYVSISYLPLFERTEDDGSALSLFLHLLAHISMRVKGGIRTSVYKRNRQVAYLDEGRVRLGLQSSFPVYENHLFSFLNITKGECYFVFPDFQFPRTETLCEI
jgi:hypothetical protein